MILVALGMLFGDRVKYVGLVFGVGFSCLLISLLLSMFNAMMWRTHALIDDMGQVNIWVMDPAVEYVEEVAPLPNTAVERVRSVAGVSWAVPLYSGALRTRLSDGRFRSVQVLGIDDATLTGLPPVMVRGDADGLRGRDAVFVDEFSARTTLALRPTDGGPSRPLTVGDTLLINDRRALVAGVCQVSPRFLPKPTIYTTYSRALAYAPPERRLMSFVLARSTAGEDASEVAKRITRETGYRARTSKEFSQDTVSFYVHHTDIVTHVGMMVGLGTFVGFAIVVLLLSMFTRENQRYYATLKAMGAGNGTVLMMLLTQAMAACVVGLGAGVGFACVIGLLGDDAGIPFLIDLRVLGFTFGCVVVMGTLAVAINARPLLKLEPGLVFRA